MNRTDFNHYFPSSLLLGKFTVSIAGVYTVALNVMGSQTTSNNAKLDMIINMADGSGQKTVCGAHVQEQTYGAASCTTLLQLEVGDELWAVGEQNGEMFAVASPFSSFQAYLLYQADVLL